MQPPPMSPPGGPGNPGGYGPPPGGPGGAPGGYGAPGGPPAYGGAPAGAPTGATGYEFNDAENKRLAAAGTFTKTFGITCFVAGGLSFLLSFTPLALVGFRAEVLVSIAVTAIGALVTFGIAYIYFSSGQALQKVVDTQGNDIEHLMSALRRLGSAFMIETILIIIGVVLVVVLLVIVLLVFGVAALGSAGAFG